MKHTRLFSLFLGVVLAACSAAVRPLPDASRSAHFGAGEESDAIEVTLLQLNDVYEISPVENGRYGGMARVATIRKELLRENPNTFTFLAGDFISPSAIGTAVYQGKRIGGAQMVAAMNAAGVDYVTFGNHEFDLGYETLQSRINESAFTWISSNIQYTPSEEGEVKPFWKVVNGVEQPLPEHVVLRAKNAEGKELRIGVFGVTIGTQQPPYVVWTDPMNAAQRAVEQLKPHVDFIIAVTHLSLDDDRKLALLVPEVKLILGGHEHTNMMFKVGETLISKADANARTVFIHRLRWSAAKKAVRITSEVRTVDHTIAEDSATAAVVRAWTARAYEGFRAQGFDPDEVVATLPGPLDGRESSIRYRQTNMGATVAQAMLAAATKATVAIFNSGSIRLDDELRGTITQYDVIRTLPFGGKIVEVEMKGSLLQRVLEAGQRNVGRGGYLQYQGVEQNLAEGAMAGGSSQWRIAGKPLDAARNYWVIVSDYLFSGREQGIEFFNKDHPDVVTILEPNAQDAEDVRRDIRLAVIRYLQRATLRR